MPAIETCASNGSLPERRRNSAQETRPPAPLAAPGARPYRLAVLMSHPVQYIAPLFRRLAQHPEIDLTVFYCSLQGATTMKDRGFGMSFAWDVPLLDGYRYQALKNLWRGQLEGFFTCINPGIVRELIRGNFDAVMIFGWGDLTTWLAFGAARLAGIPWLLYGDSIDLYENQKSRLKQRLKHLILGRLFRHTSAFLAMGKHNRRLYERYGASAEKFFFVPYPVDHAWFERQSQAARERRDALRARYGIAPEAVVALFVGKLLPRKRPQDLLAALEVLQPQMPNLAVALAGEGELRASLEAEISARRLKNVAMLGFKNQSELPEIYALADLLVLPSSEENWGLVLNEAMACGLPVIASDRTGAAADIVKNGVNGFVYPCGDVGALAEALRNLAADAGRRQSLGKCSSEIIRNFGYEQCVQGILSALRANAGITRQAGYATRDAVSPTA